MTSDEGPAHDPSQLLVASNRGPVSFVRNDEGDIVPERGGGGLVTALTSTLGRSGGLWVASAMSEEDKEQAARGRLEVVAEDEKYNVRYLSFDADLYDRYYNRISNRILWFMHHYLWDVARMPRFDEGTRLAWAAYRQVNQAFASALVDEGEAVPTTPTYLIQDYHLALTPAMIRRRRPDARIGHFAHTPFAGPSYLAILPNHMREELLTGLLGADVLGFQSQAWAENFLLSCRRLEGANVDLRRQRIRWQGRDIRVRVYPISVDSASLEELSASDGVARARRRIARARGDARLILRVDRTELSKNILRGFLAFEAFLQRHPDWRGRVKFLAHLTPSRRAIPEYRAYTRECLRTAERINDEVGETDWQPIDVVVKEDFPFAVAAYGLYDVLLVNPVYDGMNLVAKEGPVVNKRRGALILSQNAGAYAELGRHAIGVNPFDIAQTSEALAVALHMDPRERARRASGLRSAVLRSSPQKWIKAQLDDLSGSVRNRR